MINFCLDAEKQTAAIERYWEFSVGSCHAATALREDFREQLKECKKELGFKFLRFHGLFNDDMCVCRRSLFGTDLILSFTNIDSIFDFLLSIGMKPFVEIGFMPSCLAEGKETIFYYKGNITPPKNEEEWTYLITEFVKHIIARYGRDEVRSWFFEIWNEPNLCGEDGIPGGKFWSKTMDDYFSFYKLTAKAIKNVDSFLNVGGPATSNNAHLTSMREFCEKENAPLDFLSTHHYPTDIALGYGVEDSKNFVSSFNNTDKSDLTTIQKLIREYLTFSKETWKKVDRGVLTEMTKRAKEEAGDIPLYYTEWSSLAGLESDGEFGSSFIVKTVLDNMGLVKGYSYWTFSDIFEEKGLPSAAFHGGFGLITLQGIKKAPYRAFELLHTLGNEIVGEYQNDGNVDAYYFYKKESGAYQIVLINHNSLLHPISDEEVTVKIKNASLLNTATVARIDEKNANALSMWQKIGSPEYLSKEELLKLKAASEIIKAEIEVRKSGESESFFNITLLKQGVALITLYLEK